MQQANLDGLTEEQKEKRLKLVYAMMLAATVVYIIACELISGFDAGFIKSRGYAHLNDELYLKFRAGVFLVSGLIALAVIICRMAINSGRADGLAYLLLKDHLNSKADDLSMTITFMIYALASCESVGVIGLIPFLTNGDKTAAYPLLALAIILMLLFIPTREFREKLIETRKNSIKS